LEIALHDFTSSGKAWGGSARDTVDPKARKNTPITNRTNDWLSRYDIPSSSALVAE
jgi:hypothetical protein